MKFFGFTLAEILITLGIIGIVAAMTIPALITKHKRHVVAPYGTYWANGKDLTPTSVYENRKAECYNGSYTYYCAAIIQWNGWKIPKDYPHIK